jgi:hypothetical protein
MHDCRIFFGRPCLPIFQAIAWVLVASFAGSMAGPPQNSRAVQLEHDFSTLPTKPWLFPHGFWRVDDHSLRGTEDPAEHHGASIKGFASFFDGTFRYELRFEGGRVHTLGINQPRAHLFHVDFRPDEIRIVRNDLDKDGPDKPEVLAKAKLKLTAGTWYPVQVAIEGDRVQATIDGCQLSATHPTLRLEKGSFNLYVNGDSVAFRRFQLQTASLDHQTKSPP